MDFQRVFWDKFSPVTDLVRPTWGRQLSVPYIFPPLSTFSCSQLSVFAVHKKDRFGFNLEPRISETELGDGSGEEHTRRGGFGRFGPNQQTVRTRVSGDRSGEGQTRRGPWIDAPEGTLEMVAGEGRQACNQPSTM